MPKKAQGASEYLILLAIVLVVAMVAMAILSGTSASETKIAESDAYWRGVARPFAITAHSLSSANEMVLIMQNRESAQRYLSNISISGTALEGTLASAEYFSAGEERALHINLTGNPCSPGSIYEFELNFTYDSADMQLINKGQYGEKKLAGKCISPYEAPASPPSTSKLNGEACSNPNECASHHCFGGVCVQCIGNGHCISIERCVNNICVPET